MVNAYDSIYVERSGKLVKTGTSFSDEAHLRRTIDKIVSKIGRRVDETSPMVDARLPDGSRVNAIIPPLALDGSKLTIRKFSEDPYTVEDLISFGTLTRQSADLLAGCVKGRLNILVSGGTGAGKTTTLNVLSSFIPDDERIVTIEDAAELRLVQDHVLRLESRPANIEGKGAVTIRDLVKNSLRMRPDRVVVGEIRDAAALDMLQAMNTGHDGSISTLHANTPRDALSRLETMVLMAGMDLPVRAIREQVASAVDLIIQQTRLKDGTRRITAITEIVGMEGDIITTQDVFLFDYAAGMDEHGQVQGRPEVHRTATAVHRAARRPRRAYRSRRLRHRRTPMSHAPSSRRGRRARRGCARCRADVAASSPTTRSPSTTSRPADGTVVLLLCRPASRQASTADAEASRWRSRVAQVDATVNTVAAGDIERSTMLVLDASNSMQRGGKFEAAKAAVDAFLGPLPRMSASVSWPSPARCPPAIDPTTEHEAVDAALDAHHPEQGHQRLRRHRGGHRRPRRRRLALAPGALRRRRHGQRHHPGGPVPRGSRRRRGRRRRLPRRSADRADELAGLADATKGSVIPADPAALSTVFGAQADALSQQLLITFDPPADVTDDASIDVTLPPRGRPTTTPPW